MSKPIVLAVACRLAPSIKSAIRFDLDDIDVDQRIICKQRRSAFSPQALVALNWTIKFRLWRQSTRIEQQVMPHYFKVQIVFL